MSSANIPHDIYRPQNQTGSGEYSILILTADKTEDIEFFYPYYRFIEQGFRVDVATPDGGEFKGKSGLGLKETMRISDVRPDQYDLLFIPGGKAPSKLKDDDDAIAVVQEIVDAGKPVAAICHGPQLLAAAEVIDGCVLTAWPEVQKEVEEAGARYVSQECCVDGQFITGRWPADLPAFTARVLSQLTAMSEERNRLLDMDSPLTSRSLN